MISRLLAKVLTIAFIAIPSAYSAMHTIERDNVLGSSFSLTIDSDKSSAQAAGKSALTEIKRLEKIYSSYDKNSELSQINRAGSQLDIPASKDLINIVQLCQHWQQQLAMAFSCRLGEVKTAWQQAAKQQTRPDRKAIRAIARRALYSKYTLNDLQSGKAPTEFKWDFGAIAKGFIIDHALEAARKAAPTAKAIAIDIGGDSRVWQSQPSAQPWHLNIANPHNIDDSQASKLGFVKAHNAAIAYSGHNARAIKIGRRSYSHILKPRDGWPKDAASSAIVIAASATEADALATALATMEIGPALDWVNQRDNTEALLIDQQGRHYASKAWYKNYQASEQISPATKSALIKFALPKIRSGNYRKPYIALWLEDSKRKVVKNLLLLGDSERWMSKNSYWWRRTGRKEPELLQVFARPTRRAGEYQLLWQGRDDFGQALPDGRYQLIIEAAREHGGHEKISIEFELGKPIKQTEKGQKEIQYLSLDIK